MLEGAVHTRFDRFKIAIQPTSVNNQYHLWHFFPTGLPIVRTQLPTGQHHYLAWMSHLST